MGFIIKKKLWGDTGFLNLNVVTAPSGYTINYLLVGGGGGGSNVVEFGDGGDGGSVISGNFSAIPSIIYTATIGQGGAGYYYNATNTGDNSDGTAGGNSILYYSRNINIAVAAGGAYTTDRVTPNGGYGAGVNAGNGGNGGNGITSNITGSSVYYAGGGGGYTGVIGTPGLGLIGRGGNSGLGGLTQATSGANGVVILSIPTSKYTGTITGSPTVTTNGSNTILTFTGNGTYTA